MNNFQNSSIPFISDQLEEYFADFGVSFDIFLAIFIIFLGLLVAFTGSLRYGHKLLIFVCGFLVGSYVSAMVMYLLEAQEIVLITLDEWIAGFFITGLTFGIVAIFILTFAHILLGVALGLISSAMLLELGLSNFIGNDIATGVLIFVLCILSLYLAFKVIRLIYCLVSSMLGSVFVFLGANHFTESPLTITALTSENPDTIYRLCKIAENSCYIPLFVGCFVLFLSLGHNLYGLRTNTTSRKDEK